MKLNKPSEAQIKEWEDERKANERQLTPGSAKFFVKAADFEISTTGNEQIKLILSVTDVAGDNKTMWTYLTNTPKAMYRIQHFCEAVGLSKEFETDELEDYMCLNTEGICILKLQKSKDYGEQTVVSDFAKPDEESDKDSEEFKDDDVPF